MYLLDTNVCIRVLNNSSPVLVNRLQNQSPGGIYLCSVVKAELIFGAHHSSRPADNLRVLDTFFEPFLSFPFDDSSSLVYGQIRSDLARMGTPIGPNDLMIASIALSKKLTLITANTKEFGRVIGLSIANWEVED